MKTRRILAGFVLVAIVQLAVPVAMIARREATLRLGRVYKFRTRPVDPYDAFRGRYVRLGYEQDHARWTGDTELIRRSTAYGMIEESRDGFAVVRSVGPQPPQSGDYVKLEPVYRGWGTNSADAHFTLPFDRFYMEEARAPAAERAYQEHSRRGQQDAYVIVRIRDGVGVIQNLYVGGQPIAEFIQQQPK